MYFRNLSTGEVRELDEAPGVTSSGEWVGATREEFEAELERRREVMGDATKILFDALPPEIRRGIEMSARINQMLRRSAWPYVVQTMNPEQRRTLTEICDAAKRHTAVYYHRKSVIREWCFALAASARQALIEQAASALSAAVWYRRQWNPYNGDNADIAEERRLDEAVNAARKQLISVTCQYGVVPCVANT